MNSMERAKLGRELWAMLHKRACHHDGRNDSRFIAEFGRKIPRYMRGCSCNEFWRQYIKKNPPVYTKYGYFKWTVDLHNAVNAKLGKKQISLEEARKIWCQQTK